MGVDLKKPATSVQDVATPEQPERVKLELAAYQRHFYQGNLYEKGIAYGFDVKYAEHLLERTDDDSGKPIWRRFKPKTQVRTTDLEALLAAQRAAKVPEVDVATPKAKPKADDGDVKPRPIHIGDESEIADIVSSIPDDEPGTVQV